MKEKTLNAARIIVLSAVFASAIGYSLADWVPPSGTPPFGNTPPPINVGGATQVKEGNLFINNQFWAKKARSLSTVSTDSGDTLVTKDYVDGKTGTQFGGIYTKNFDGSCRYRNPLAGNRCSCPSGYNKTQFHEFFAGQCQFYQDGFRTSNCGINEYYCWK